MGIESKCLLGDGGDLSEDSREIAGGAKGDRKDDFYQVFGCNGLRHLTQGEKKNFLLQEEVKR